MTPPHAITRRMSEEYWYKDRGKALLRQAYPDGVLAHIGVITLGGYTITDVEDGPHTQQRFWAQRGNGNYVLWSRRYGSFFTGGAITPVMALQHMREGEFLPKPDPANTATWACMMADLGEALSAPAQLKRVLSYSWLPENPGRWQLAAYGLTTHHAYGIGRQLRIFSLPTVMEPAEALIRARIIVRKEQDQNK